MNNKAVIEINQCFECKYIKNLLRDYRCSLVIEAGYSKWIQNPGEIPDWCPKLNKEIIDGTRRIETIIG